MDPLLDAFVRQLPKAELHVHLEGTLEPEMLLTLARRNDVAIPWASADALRAAYRFGDLQSFLDLYYAGTRVMVHEQDFYDVTRAYLRRAHADGVVRVEAYFGPQSFTERGIGVDESLGGVLRAMDDARADDGIVAGVVVSTQRHRTEEAAFEQLDLLRPWGESIVAFGLGGAELPHPPATFERFFAEVRRQGYRVTIHAGEEGPAAYVAQALDVLGADRIDHGVRAMEDPSLVARLRDTQVPLTVCPVSNVVLKTVPDLASHPLPAMLAAGLNVSVNSDDPAYFGGYVGDVLVRCAETFGWGTDELETLAANSLRAAT